MAWVAALGGGPGWVPCPALPCRSPPVPRMVARQQGRHRCCQCLVGMGWVSSTGNSAAHVQLAQPSPRAPALPRPPRHGLCLAAPVPDPPPPRCLRRCSASRRQRGASPARSGTKQAGGTRSSGGEVWQEAVVWRASAGTQHAAAHAWAAASPPRSARGRKRGREPTAPSSGVDVAWRPQASARHALPHAPAQPCVQPSGLPPPPARTHAGSRRQGVSRSLLWRRCRRCGSGGFSMSPACPSPCLLAGPPAGRLAGWRAGWVHLLGLLAG